MAFDDQKVCPQVYNPCIHTKPTPSTISIDFEHRSIRSEVVLTGLRDQHTPMGAQRLRDHVACGTHVFEVSDVFGMCHGSACVGRHAWQHDLEDGCLVQTDESNLVAVINEIYNMACPVAIMIT